jgi:hypothetical protein
MPLAAGVVGHRVGGALNVVGTGDTTVCPLEERVQPQEIPNHTLKYRTAPKKIQCTIQPFVQ